MAKRESAWYKKMRSASGTRFLRITPNPPLATHPKGHKYRRASDFVAVTRGGSVGGKDGANASGLKARDRKWAGRRAKLVPFQWPPGVAMPHLAER